MKRGRLSYSKVRALTRVARLDTEESLLDLGRAGTAAHVERVVRAWRRIDRTIEPREDELRDALSTVTTHIDENGMFVIRGRLAPEAGELLLKALEAAGEALFDKGSDDRPPIGKQRADALVLIAESALAGGLNGARPRRPSAFTPPKTSSGNWKTPAFSSPARSPFPLGTASHWICAMRWRSCGAHHRIWRLRQRGMERRRGPRRAGHPRTRGRSRI